MQEFVEIDPYKPVKDELLRVFNGFIIEIFTPEDFPPEQVPPPDCLFDRYGISTEVLETYPREAYVRKIEELFEIKIDRYNVLDHILACTDAVFVLYLDEIVVGVLNRDMVTLSVQGDKPSYMNTLDKQMLVEFRERP